MANNLGALTVDLILKFGGWIDGLSKSERETKKFKANVEKNLKAAGTAFVTLGIAGAAATAALIKSSINSADALLEQSQMFGVSVELLSSYKLGLEQAGTSNEDFAVGLKGLANAVDSDSEAFKRLQISTKNADGSLKDSNDLLEEIAGRFASMEDGITKTALAQDLFGKSGFKLIPFLNQGADGLAAMRQEAERLGLVISQDTAEAADQFNDNLLTLKAVVTGTGNELAAALLPRLVEFTDLLKDPETQQAIKDIVTGMANMAIKAVELAAAIPDLGRDLAAAFGGAALGDIPRLQEELAEMQRKAEYWDTHTLLPGSDEQAAAARARIAEVEELIRVSEQLEAMAGANTTTAPAAVQSVFVPTEAGSSKDATKAADEWKKQMEEALDKSEQAIEKIKAIDDARIEMNSGMEREIALYGETSQAAILRYDIEHGQLAVLTEENKAYSIALAEQLDLKKKLAEEAANDEEFQATAAGLQKQIDLLGNTSKAAELLYDVQHGGYDQFKEDQQETLVFLAQELEAREQMLEDFEAAEKAKAEIMEEFLENTQGILADFLFDPFEDGVDGMVDQFSNMLKRLAAEAVAADIMKFFVGQASGGGWLGALAGAFAGSKDGGGTIGSGQWGIVGEVGPEIVRGPANVTSRADTAAMMGSKNNYNNTFVFPNVRTKEEASQAGVSAAREFLSTISFANRRR